MNFFKKEKITFLDSVKFGGFAIVVLILVVLIFALVKVAFQGISTGLGRNVFPSAMPSSKTFGYAEDAVYSSPGVATELSVRNVTTGIVPPYNGGTTGSTAEDFEVTDYNATIETRNLKKTCGALVALKSAEDVIFENSSEGTSNCSYTFKVKHIKVEGVLTTIEKLDPRELSENTYTIQRQIDDFTSEMEILQKKRASIDATLDSALKAYEEITKLATKTQNAEALAKIIDSKIQIITRLTNERISINEQLDRLARTKVDQLDRLEYTRFYVSVYERRYIDGQQLADSWKQEIRNLVEGVNSAIQFATVRLLTFLLWLLPSILYLFVLVFLVKYVWKAIRKVWFN